MNVLVVLLTSTALLLLCQSDTYAEEPSFAPFSFCRAACLEPRESRLVFPGASLLSDSVNRGAALLLSESENDAPQIAPIPNVTPATTTLRATNSTRSYVEAASPASSNVFFSSADLSSPRGSDRESETEFPIVRASDLSVLAIDPYRGRVFGYGLASWGVQEAQGTIADLGGFDVGSYGGALGQDWSLTKYFIWGYGVQATQTELEAKSARAYDSKIDATSAFLHMSVYDALWHIDLRYGASRNWETQSSLISGAQQKFAATEWFFETEMGARFDQGYTRIEPRFNFRVLSLIEPNTAERFITSKSNKSDFSGNSFRLKLGSRFSWEYATMLGVLKPYINVDWSHEFGDRLIYTIDDQALAPVAYRFGAHKMARDKMDLGAGFDYALRDTFDVYMRYDVEVAHYYSDYLFFAGFNKKF